MSQFRRGERFLGSRGPSIPCFIRIGKIDALRKLGKHVPKKGMIELNRSHAVFRRIPIARVGEFEGAEQRLISGFIHRWQVGNRTALLQKSHDFLRKTRALCSPICED